MGIVRPRAVLQEANELEVRGQTKEASRKYASLISVLMRRGKPAEALMLIEKVLTLSPDSTRLYLKKALCSLEMKRENDAFVAIENLAIAAIRQNRISDYMDLVSEKAKAFPKIQQAFAEKLLSVERARADIFVFLAEALYRLGKVERCYEIVFSALKVDSQNDSALKFLKRLMTEQGQSTDLKGLQKLVSGDWSVDKVKQYVMAEVHRRGDKKKGLDSEFGSHSILKSLDEENASTLKNLIDSLEAELGESPSGIESVSGLVSEFKEKALKVLQQDSKTLIDLAIAFKEMGIEAEAKDIISKIGSHESQYHDAQCLLGRIEFESGAYFASLDIFQHLLRQHKLNDECQKDALYHLARIYMHINDINKAHHFADKLSKMDSNYRSLSRLRLDINALREKSSKPKQNK
ncbi:MAG: hypothetical protein ACKOA8_06405 [Deltaproteobacteria bacterium]